MKTFCDYFTYDIHPYWQILLILKYENLITETNIKNIILKHKNPPANDYCSFDLTYNRNLTLTFNAANESFYPAA